MEKTVTVWIKCPECTYEHEHTLPAVALEPFAADWDEVYRDLPFDPAFLCRECYREYENQWMKEILAEKASQTKVA